MIYIFWTAADFQEAEAIARGLVEEKLVACGTLLPKVQSIYRWQGKVERSEEVKVLFKTRSSLFERVTSYICKHTSYTVPEIAAVEVQKVFPPYLAWLMEQTTEPVAKLQFGPKFALLPLDSVTS